MGLLVQRFHRFLITNLGLFNFPIAVSRMTSLKSPACKNTQGLNFIVSIFYFTPQFLLGFGPISKMRVEPLMISLCFSNGVFNGFPCFHHFS